MSGWRIYRLLAALAVASTALPIETEAEVLTHKIQSLTVTLEPQSDGSVVVTEQFEIELNPLLDEYKWFVRRLPRMVANPSEIEIIDVIRNDRSEPWTLHNLTYPQALVVGTNFRNPLRDISQTYVLKYTQYDVAELSTKRSSVLWDFRPSESRFRPAAGSKLNITVLGRDGVSILRTYLQIDESGDYEAIVSETDGVSIAQIGLDLTDLTESRSWVVRARFEPGSIAGESYLETLYREIFRSHRIAGGMALIVVIGFYAVAWHYTSRRTRRFKLAPGEQLSPALMCFVANGRFKPHIVDVVLRNLMRKNLLRFDIDPDGALAIVRCLAHERKDDPSPEEQVFLDALFASGEPVVQLAGSDRQRLDAAGLALRAAVEGRFQQLSITANRVWVVVGLALAGGTVLALALYEPNYALAVEMAWPILPLLAGIGGLTWMAMEMWHRSWTNARGIAWIEAIFVTLVLVALIAALRFFLSQTIDRIGYISAVLVCLAIALSGVILFGQNRRVRTGAEVRGQLRAMRKRIAQTLESPNIALAEDLVPYAMALDGSGKWSHELERWLRKGKKKSSDVDVNPWYDGGSVNLVDYGRVAHYLPRR